MKIPLFYKTITTGASFFFLLAIFILLSPTQASAGFFSNLVDNLTGSTSSLSASVASASDSSSSGTDNKSYNSQTVPLLETTTTPGATKVLGSISTASIVEEQAIQPSENSLGFDSDINPYISSSSEKIETYTVDKGDTLGEIAKKFNISENTILFANPDIKKNALKVGDNLIILPVNGVTYTVKKGDTLGAIAIKYKASIEDIADFNNIDREKGLKIGDSIIVPGGTMPKKVAIVKPIEEKINTESISKSTQTETIQAPSTKESDDGYIWPLSSGVGRISQGIHDGKAVDIAAPKGSSIYSIANGTVLVASSSGNGGGYGKYVVVNLDNGAQVLYGHMSKVIAVRGQRVNQGDVLGLVGSTGHSTGNHIHLETRGPLKNPFGKLHKNDVSNDYYNNN